MLCLDASATGHSRISSSHHVHFEWAVFDLDLRPGYLCNHGAATRNDILFFSTQPRVSNWGHFFLQFGLVRGYELPRRTWRPLSRNILVNNISSLFPSASLTSDTHTHTHTQKEKKKPVTDAALAERRQKRCVHICTAFEGTWRHLESLFFSTSLSLSRSLSFFWNWLHKKASCEPSSLNEKHVAGIQNSGVFQHGPGRHLFLVCTAKSWSRERGCGGNGVGEGGGEEEKRRFFFFVFFQGGDIWVFFF